MNIFAGKLFFKINSFSTDEQLERKFNPTHGDFFSISPSLNVFIIYEVDFKLQNVIYSSENFQTVRTV